MNLRTAMATRNELVQVFQRLIDAAGEAGEIRIYSGRQPRSADDEANGTLLARLTFSRESAPASENATLTFAEIAEEPSARASGEAAWARIVDGDGKTVFDCDVSDDSGNGTIRLNSTSIVAGGIVRLRSFSLSQPDG